MELLKVKKEFVVIIQEPKAKIGAIWGTLGCRVSVSKSNVLALQMQLQDKPHRAPYSARFQPHRASQTETLKPVLFEKRFVEPL